MLVQPSAPSTMRQRIAAATPIALHKIQAGKNEPKTSCDGDRLQPAGQSSAGSQ